VLSLRPQARPADPPVARFELFVDGRRQATSPRAGGSAGASPSQGNGSAGASPSHSEELKLDTAKLSAGYHELRVVAVLGDSLETQGQCILPFYCREVPRFSVSLPQRPAPSSPPPTPKTDNPKPITVLPSVPYGQPCHIRAEMGGMEQIDFHCGGSLVGTIAGGNGTVALDTRRLGIGTVLIQPVGFRPAGDGGPSPVYARPFTLTVAPPDILKGTPVDGKSLAKGLLLRTVDRTAILDKDTLPQALAKASLKQGQPFTLEGYFGVPAQDLYQFQLRFNGKASIEVDGVPHHRPADQVWTFIPVHLAPGTHHLKAALEPAGTPANFDLRLGNQGAQTIRPERFRCPS
jgi:hypothetical protein